MSHTPATPAPSASRGGFPEVARGHVRHNFGAHLLDGALFGGAMAFVAADTVIPYMVTEFGAPAFLIAYTPLLMPLGTMLPPFLAAQLVERRTQMLRYVRVLGILERLPYLMAALALLFFGSTHPGVVVMLALLAPLMAGFANGMISPAWSELIVRTMPPERRGLLHGTRMMLGAGIGFAAGFTIEGVLTQLPGAHGYALLYGCCFVLLMGSWIALCRVREVPLPERRRKDPLTLRQHLKRLPQLLRADRRLRYMALVNCLSPLIFVFIPFLSVFAIQASDRGPGFIGTLVIAKTAGLVVGNLIGGLLADRVGGRLPLLLSRCMAVVPCIGAFLEGEAWFFLGLFFIYGISFAFHMIGNEVLKAELAPDAQRPSYVGVLALCAFPGYLLIPSLAGWIQESFWGLPALAVFVGAGLLVSAGLIARIREPRLDFEAGAPQSVPAPREQGLSQAP